MGQCYIKLSMMKTNICFHFGLLLPSLITDLTPCPPSLKRKGVKKSGNGSFTPLHLGEGFPGSFLCNKTGSGIRSDLTPCPPSLKRKGVKRNGEPSYPPLRLGEVSGVRSSMLRSGKGFPGSIINILTGLRVRSDLTPCLPSLKRKGVKRSGEPSYPLGDEV